jgi:hypothetical protein
MRRHRLALSFALFALVAGSAAASQYWYSAFSHSDSVSNATETKLFKHNFAAPAAGARLKLHLKLSGGEAVIRLVDPTGAKRYEQTFRSGEASIEETFTGKTGEWQIAVDFRHASGKYSVRLTGV